MFLLGFLRKITKNSQILVFLVYIPLYSQRKTFYSVLVSYIVEHAVINFG